jgi:hypothetical protein
MRAYEVNVKGKDWASVERAETAGKAKYLYLLGVREAWPDITFKHLTCRALKSIPPTKIEIAQREADAFNAKYPVGTVVRYWSGEKDGEPSGVAPIWHPATVVCEHAVAWPGKLGISCHSLSHVEVI